MTFQKNAQITSSLAIVVNIPNEKSPNNGPPTTPKIVNAACKTPPKNCARYATAMQTIPYINESSFVCMPAVASEMSLLNNILWTG